MLLTMGYIDIHTHIFPDALAEKTIPFLEEEGNVKAVLNGKLSDLLNSMDRADIEKSATCFIATRPEQFENILRFSEKIRSDRIIPLPSIHPDGDKRLDQIQEIAANGFAGIKLHPYYQQFSLDEDRMLPVYEKLCETGLVLVMHTGFDIAFPRDPIASPERILNVIKRFPELKMVTTHLGAWDQWEDVEKVLLGKPVYMDISFSLHMTDRDYARQFLLRHPKEYVLFGSDSPWADQRETINQLRSLELGEERERLILRDNAQNLLFPS